MRTQIPLLIILACAMVAASTLPGCVTQTSTLNNTSTISTTVSGRAATKSSTDDNSLTAPTHYLVTIGKTMVYAEAANTPEERETGLHESDLFE